MLIYHIPFRLLNRPIKFILHQCYDVQRTKSEIAKRYSAAFLLCLCCRLTREYTNEKLSKVTERHHALSKLNFSNIH